MQLKLLTIALLGLSLIACEEDWDFTKSGGQLLTRVEEHRNDITSITTYEYDEYDRPVKKMLDHGRAKQTSTITYEGRLARLIEHQHNSKDNDFTIIFVDSLFYNEKNQLVEVLKYEENADGELEATTKKQFSYNADGRVDTIYSFSISEYSQTNLDEPDSRNIYTWENGNLAMETYQSYYGEFPETIYYTFFEYGKGYNPYGSVLLFEPEYPSKNNLIKKDYQFVKGQGCWFVCPAVSVKKWKYNDSNYPTTPKRSVCGSISFTYKPQTFFPEG
jgi:hypothetical protein